MIAETTITIALNKMSVRRHTKFIFNGGWMFTRNPKIINVHVSCRRIFKTLQAIESKFCANPNAFARRKNLRNRHKKIIGGKTENAQSFILYCQPQIDDIGRIALNKLLNTVDSHLDLIAVMLFSKREGRKRFAHYNQSSLFIHLLWRKLDQGFNC